MPTLIERARASLADVLLGSEKEKLERTTRMLYDAYLEGPWVRTPEQLVSELVEQDASIITDLLLQLGWESYGLGYTLDSSAERTRAVNESRRLWKYSVIAQWIVNLWTSFGLGESIVITPQSEEPMSGETDEDGNKLPVACVVWDEFWSADRNAALLAEDKIHDKLSNWLLVDGERFLAFYGSDQDGECTVRRVPAEEMVEVVTDPNDSATPWWYKRVFTQSGKSNQTWYYPDWALFFSDGLEEAAEVLPNGAIRADKVNANEGELGDGRAAGTAVCILHIPLSGRDESDLRGWPLLSPAGAPWIRAHKKFREDRAAVAAHVAMFVSKLKHKGGSRAGAALAAQMQSALSSSNSTETNPPAVAGSTWVGNQAVDLTRLPLGSGASDAKSDGEAMLLMAGLSGGVFPHYLGAGDAYRLATATAMERPLELQWSRYRQFWSAQFRKMVKIVLKFHEKYNGVTFDTYDAEVSTDQLVQTDAAALTEAVSSYYRDVLIPQLEADNVDRDAVKKITARVSRTVLQAIGVADADEVASDEAFKVGVEDEEPEPEPEMPPMPPEPPMTESHVPTYVEHTCPLCGYTQAERYAGHGNLLRCVQCKKTYNPVIE